MGRKATYSKELKLEIIKRYEEGESSLQLAKKYGLSQRYIITLIHKYEELGEKAFDYKVKHKSYSKELKLAAIKEYLEEQGSLSQIGIKYGLTNHELLRKWIIKYNSHIEITDYNPKPEVYMAKARKTTYEERIETVKYCLEEGFTYKEAAIKFGVNYSQVYSWVKRYKENGEEGLLDRRGRNKLESEMTEEEKLKYQFKKLEAKNAYLEMEVKALKKLEEIERRTIRRKSR